MSDLYDELGVPKDASQEEIRAAYRKKAAETHPDRPDGDEEAFKRVNHAHLILSDAEKREQYDRSGSENTASPEERELAMALEKIAGHFGQLFEMAEFDPALHDPLKGVRKLLKMERKEVEKNIAAVELRLAKMKKVVKRLRRKGNEKKATRLEGVLRNLEQAANSLIDKGQRTLRVIAKALEIMSEHTYELDQETPEQLAAAAAMAALREKLVLKYGAEGLKGAMPG